MGYEEQYKQYVSDIETALQTAFPLKKITERCIYESARYSLLAGGQARQTGAAAGVCDPVWLR